MEIQVTGLDKGFLLDEQKKLTQVLKLKGERVMTLMSFYWIYKGGLLKASIKETYGVEQRRIEERTYPVTIFK